MSNFKIGDRVVLIKNTSYPEYIGASGFIKSTNSSYSGRGAIVSMTYDDPKRGEFQGIQTIEDHIEFEDVYNSPLYQALK